MSIEACVLFALVDGCSFSRFSALAMVVLGIRFNVAIDDCF